MIRRPPRSTPLYSSAASDVYKRQVLVRLLHTTASACCASIRVAVGLEQAVCSASCLAWLHHVTREEKCQGHGSSPQRANILGCIRARGAWRGNGSTRPVLKHGPESLTCMQACGCIRVLCTMKVTAGILLSPPLSLSRSLPLSPALSLSPSLSVALSLSLLSLIHI